MFLHYQCWFLLLCLTGIATCIEILHVKPSTRHNASLHGSLHYYLCGEGYANLSSSLILSLDSHGEHILSSDISCKISSFSNFTLSSDNASRSAQIFCSKDGNHGSGGLGFYNITSLNISWLTFHHCGGNIGSLVAPINTSRIYFEQETSAVLAIIGSTNVSVSGVTIKGHYCGYGMIISNSRMVYIETVTINYSSNDNLCIYRENEAVCTTSGLLIYYYSSSQWNSTKINAKTLWIKCNVNWYRRVDVQKFFQKNRTRVPIYNISSSGLTILLGDVNFNHTSQIWFYDLHLIHNRMGGGALLLYEMRRFLGPLVHFDSFILSQNNATTNGGGLAVYFVVVLPNSVTLKPDQVSKCIICLNNGSIIAQNAAGYGGGAYIAIGMNKDFWVPPIILDTVEFQNNVASYGAFGLYVHSFLLAYNKRSKVTEQADFTIILKGSYVSDNGIPPTGRKLIYFSKLPAIQFVNIKLGIIVGFSAFVYNMGSAISAYTSNVGLLGYILFQKNRALHGAALNLQSNSLVVFHSLAIVKFIENTAYSYGGAIYSENAYCPVYFLEKTGRELFFIENTAYLEGDAIYFEGMSKECKNTLNSHVFKYSPKDFEMNQNVSSPPVKLEFCNEPNYTEYPLTGVYPGKLIQINISALDSNGKKVYSPVAVTISNDKSLDKSEQWTLPSEQSVQLLGSKNCTTLNLTIFYTLGIQHSATTYVHVAILGQLPFLSISFTMNDCPLGFELKLDGCKCHSFLLENNITDECDINTFQIGIKANAWLGPVIYNNNTDRLEHSSSGAKIKKVLGYSPTCPSGYCVNGISKANVKDWDEMCHGHRTGVLCGECLEGYSVAWGTTECLKCRHFHIWTIIGVIVLSILTIFMLFLTRLTIANETLGTIIFYANIQATFFYHKLDKIPIYIKVFAFFFSCLNDTLSLPTCLSSHMTSVGKSGSFFAFPVFLLLIVAGLVFSSYHSTKIANFIAHSSIQVVATLLYLSFAKLLLTVINILTPVTIHTPERDFTVWYIDGSIPYGQDPGHIALTIIALFTLIFILFPFLFFTTFGSLLLSIRYLRPYSIYIRPFIDSYQGPYRSHYKFWFGLRLWLLLYIYICYTFLRGHKPLVMLSAQMIPLLLFTVAQSYIKPYHSRVTNIIDLFVLYNILICYLVMIYFYRATGEKDTAEAYLFILAGPIVVLFFYLVVYHLLKRFQINSKLSNFFCWVKVRNMLNVLPKNRMEYEEITGDENTRLREPLLENNK